MRFTAKQTVENYLLGIFVILKQRKLNIITKTGWNLKKKIVRWG